MRLWLTSSLEAWTIYKEVAMYYGAGLTPPEYVTLVLPDDNWGNKQRFLHQMSCLEQAVAGYG